jgi:hypothetical protein
MSKKFLMIEAAVIAVLIAIYCFAGRAGGGEPPAGQSVLAPEQPEQNGTNGTVDLERPPFLGE